MDTLLPTRSIHFFFSSSAPLLAEECCHGSGVLHPGVLPILGDSTLPKVGGDPDDRDVPLSLDSMSLVGDPGGSGVATLRSENIERKEKRK